MAEGCAIAWGEQVLASEITTVAGGRLFYRGRDAIRLAESETLESVARLLRGGHGAALKRTDRPEPPRHPDMRTRAYLALAARAGSDPPARGRHPLVLAVEAATLLGRRLTDAIAGEAWGGAIHNRLSLAWGLGPGGPGADLIRRILVLVADHELNPSAFVARVAASTGASLSASALAGLATLSGPRHGGATAAVRTFAAEAAQLGPRQAIANRLVEDRSLPGFMATCSIPMATRAPPPTAGALHAATGSAGASPGGAGGRGPRAQCRLHPDGRLRGAAPAAPTRPSPSFAVALLRRLDRPRHRAGLQAGGPDPPARPLSAPNFLDFG